MVLNDAKIYFAEGPVTTASFTKANVLARVAAFGMPVETIDTVERTYFNTDHVKQYGTGYSEIYCHIPTDVPAYKYKVNQVKAGKQVVNDKNTAEGYKDVDITGYPNEYYYERSHIFEFDKDFYSLEEQQNKQPNRDPDYLDKYTFNTIIIICDDLYSSYCSFSCWER